MVARVDQSRCKTAMRLEPIADAAKYQIIHSTAVGHTDYEATRLPVQFQFEQSNEFSRFFHMGLSRRVSISDSDCDIKKRADLKQK